MDSKSTALEIETAKVRPVEENTPTHKTSYEVEKRLENVITAPANFVYDDDDEEPELHARTYFALAAMFFLNLVQVLALQGPPAVVCNAVSTSLELH